MPASPLAAWIKRSGFAGVGIDKQDEKDALAFRQQYQPREKAGIGKLKGASINDFRLIAYARNKGCTVVTLEGVQGKKPGQMPGNTANYKIPLICQMKDVPCISYVDFLRALKIIL